MEIKIRREYGAVPPVSLEKHKALQILLNLIQNAMNAMNERRPTGQAIDLARGSRGGRWAADFCD